MLARINAAIGAASYIGEAYFEDSEGDDEPIQREDAQPELLATAMENRLVEVVPAAVLDRLKTVDFVPITILDQILRSPESMRALTARDFERFIATLIDQLGFENVVITPRSGDQGRDVLATKTMHGIPILFAFECKRYRPDSRVGPEILRALLGTITHGPTKANKGVLVTTSTFTSGARTYILTEPSLDGKDFDGISAWLKEYARQGRR
jgi:HJR/Mrr/RecB family endonuclease